MILSTLLFLAVDQKKNQAYNL